MRFLCFRLCSKTKNIAVHEPTLPEEKPTADEKSNDASVRDSISMRDGSQKNIEPKRKLSRSHGERKISVDQFSHAFIDEYASSSAPGSPVDSKRNC